MLKSLTLNMVIKIPNLNFPPLPDPEYGNFVIKTFLQERGIQLLKELLIYLLGLPPLKTLLYSQPSPSNKISVLEAYTASNSPPPPQSTPLEYLKNAQYVSI